MALPNGDLITTVFDPQMAYPVDKRMQVDTLNSRDSMSMFIRWEGMEVYVLENSKKYILQGGRSNEYWKENGTGTGTGGTTFVGQFATADLLPTTGRSAGDYAFVGTGDDFVQYNWDNISGQWVMAEGQTDMASEFFHIGYKTPIRRPVIFPLFPKDVLVETGGDFVFAPATAVARFIFTGVVDAVRGIETAEADREIKLVNRTGSDIPLRDKASGIPSGSGMDFGGTDYTWVNGSEITLKGNGTYWQLAPNNQVAFSDHLDSVNAQVSVGSDGLEVITGVYDRYTGNSVQFKEISGSHTADGIVIVSYNGKFFRRTDKEYYIDSFGVLGVGNDSAVFQEALNLVSKTQSKYLVIDGYDLVLTTLVASPTDNLIIEFRNGAKISQPIPATNTTWADQKQRLSITGDNITFINFQTDGKFDNNGLNQVPDDVNLFVRITGDNCIFKGKTSLKNSGGYNLDISGDECYIEDIEIKNNAYSGLRLAVVKDIKSFKIGRLIAENNVGPIARKTGLTINGGYMIGAIEIDTYIGLNAYPYSQATLDPNDFFYQNYKIGYLRNELTEQIFNPDGSPAVNYSGKMESIANLSIGTLDCQNTNPALDGRGMWFDQVQNCRIGQINTNAGDWLFGKKTQIGKWVYTYSSNSGDCLFRISPSNSSIEINVFECNIPTDENPYAALFRSDSSTKKCKIGTIYFSEKSIGLARAEPNYVKGLIEVDNYSSNLLTQSVAVGSFRQSISFNQKVQYVISPTSLLRDVIKGEVFKFDTTDHLKWEVATSGTCSWSGSTFTGTAVFTKTIANKNYVGTALTNMTNFLTSNDAGMVALVDATMSRWNGSAWVMIPTTSPTNRSGTDIAIDRSYVGRFNSFIGPAGNITIPADVFLVGDEIQGQTVGGTKTFIAGAGLTLRGSNLVLSTGQRYSIKFRTPTDATITIYPSTSYSTLLSLTDTPSSFASQKNKTLKVNNGETAVVFVADGVDVRNISDSGSIAPTLTDGFIGSRLNFTSSTAVTLQGFTSAGGQSSVTLVNPHATNDLTLVHNGAGTVKYIDPGSTDLVIAPKTAVKVEIVGNEIYRVL